MIDVIIDKKEVNVAIENAKILESSTFDEKFWNIYQNNGNRKNYNYAFGGEGWTKETFNPKYDIIPDRCDYMFRVMSEFREDMVEHLGNLGVTLDFSKSTLFSECFAYCYAKRIGIIDTRNASSLISVFSNSRMVTIDKLILKDDGSQNLNSTFQGCSYLENLIVEGTIGYNGTNFSWSTKLTEESLLSILTALSKNPLIAQGKAVTFSLESKEKIDGYMELTDQAELAKDAGWTISYI